MFGYRLLPASDVTELKDERTRLLAEQVKLLRELGTVRASLGAMTASRDLLIARINVCEQELATFKHQATGLPIPLSQIAKGNAAVNAALGAGADLFEDVGDEKAELLRVQGLLHDTPDRDEAMSAPPIAPARELVPAGD